MGKSWAMLMDWTCKEHAHKAEFDVFLGDEPGCLGG